MRDLSILIPSKNEEWLKNTVEDVLAASQADTEVIIICDGALPVEAINEHPRVRLYYRFPGIGQRAATNEAARLSEAKYIMKLDAHCRVSPGFDKALIEDCQPDWTMVPTQYRLHVFDWKCSVCENRTYQGRTPIECQNCHDPAAKFEKVLVWEPRFNKGASETWRFDSNLHFQYDHAMMKRPEIKAQGAVHDTMSFLGACWFTERKRYWELDGLDEAHGGQAGWGQVGVEVACKTWLSGGRLVTTQKAWFAHLFRTGGGDFSFPYPIKSNEQENARRYSQSVWLNNRWPKQRYPLSALIEKFWPVADWTEQDLSRLRETARSFRVVDPLANLASPHPLTEGSGINWSGQEMAADTMSLATVDGGGGVRPCEVDRIANELQVNREAASPVLANDMIQNRDILPAPIRNRTDEPSVNDAMDQGFSTRIAHPPVTVIVKPSRPLPTSGDRIGGDLGEKRSNLLGCEKGNGEILLSIHDSTSVVESGIGSEKSGELSGPSILANHKTKGIIFYTDCLLADPIAEACQRQLRKAAGNIPIIAVSLGKAIDFGDENIIIQGERGPKTMFRQILAGLERSTADHVYFCEHDCLMPKEHFDFVPPRDDVFYYNASFYRVSAVTGKAVTYQTKALSGLCANRLLLIEHYYRRLAKMAENVRTTIARGGKVKKDGHDKSCGWEPGAPYLQRARIDDYKSETYTSSVPYLDIREHGSNYTKTRWSQAGFDDQRTCTGWREIEAGEAIPGWEVVEGRFEEFLAALSER